MSDWDDDLAFLSLLLSEWDSAEDAAAYDELGQEQDMSSRGASPPPA